jgi:indole-3-glycerol phosphate synthase
MPNLETSVQTSDCKPQTILEEIVAHKKQEVARMRDRISWEQLQSQVNKSSPPRDFLAGLDLSINQPSLIAEVKKASPSKGIIRADFDPVKIAQSYERGGAACLSVLCDRKFFQGSFENLLAVRQHVSLPLLCKEFIIDPLQIYWARACGADAVLLIAAILSDRELSPLLKLTHNLGMEALVEVHTLAECDRALKLPQLRLLGINNRNLENFSVDLNVTQDILAQKQELLKSITVVSESGLYTKADLDFVAQAGANAVLIGESLLKQPDLEAAVKKLFNDD